MRPTTSKDALRSSQLFRRPTVSKHKKPQGHPELNSFKGKATRDSRMSFRSGLTANPPPRTRCVISCPFLFSIINLTKNPLFLRIFKPIYSLYIQITLRIFIDSGYSTFRRLRTNQNPGSTATRPLSISKRRERRENLVQQEKRRKIQ